MRPDRRYWFVFAMIALLAFAGCSDDDDDGPTTPPAPEDPRVDTIVVEPDSVALDGIGDEIRFEAVAFDQNSDVIDTVFVWESTDENVVVVDQMGNTVSTGIGTAEIQVTAGTVTETAHVTVTLGEAQVVEWTSGGSGDWTEPSNWSTGEVPGPNDLAVISEAGSYSVLLNGDVQVRGLVLGGDAATPVLDTNDFTMEVRSGGMYPGAELIVQSEFIIIGDFVWTGGDVSGGGVIEVWSSAEVHQTGNPVNVDAVIENAGNLIAYAGSSLRINDQLANMTGGLVELQGDAILTVQFDGLFTSSGTIQKSQGTEEASILVSSTDNSDLDVPGTIQVDVGTLRISDGTLRGRATIAAGATLRQSGNTTIPRLNVTGDGDFVVGGRASFGAFSSDVIDFPNFILDSTSLPSLTGPAAVLVYDKFVWRQGVVALDGNLVSHIRSLNTFEGTGRKVLTACTWEISGIVEVDENFTLELDRAGRVRLDHNGIWEQKSAGSITQGAGDIGWFEIIGLFEKTESELTFTVDPDVTCSGTMDLQEGPFVARGRFTLLETGILTGGGTKDLTQNVRLNVVNATAPEIWGTIRPEVNRGPARLDIQGAVALSPTATIELDVNPSDDFDTESVYFLSSAIEFDGTLALNVVRIPPDGAQYRVIHNHVPRGEFDVTGDEPFADVVQDELGVLCIR